MVQHELIIIHVAGLPADLLPEGVPGVVVGKGDQGDLVDAHLPQALHAVAHHAGADALPPVLPGDADVVQRALPPVRAAEYGADDPAVQPGHHAGGGVAADEPGDIFPGIVQRPDAEALNGHPQRPDLVVVLLAHGQYPDLICQRQSSSPPSRPRPAGYSYFGSQRLRLPCPGCRIGRPAGRARRCPPRGSPCRPGPKAPRRTKSPPRPGRPNSAPRGRHSNPGRPPSRRRCRRTAAWRTGARRPPCRCRSRPRWA